MRVFSYSHTEAGIRARARAKLAGTIAYQIDTSEPKPIGPSPEQKRAEKRTVLEMRRRHDLAKWEAKVEAERERRIELYADFRHLDIQEHKPLARDIIARVAVFHGFTPEDIVSKRRQRALIVARFDAIKAVADLRPDMTLPLLGKIFNRDHTTILHALGRLGARKRPTPSE